MSVTLPRAAGPLSGLRDMVAAALPAGEVMSSSSRGRVLLLTDRLVRGGAEQMLAGYAPRLLAAGFEVRVALLAEGADDPLAQRLAGDGIAVDAMPFRRLLDPAAGWRLLQHVRRLRPDVIHTQQPWANLWGTLAGRLQRVPALATLHTLDEIDRDRRAGHARFSDKVLNRGAARIICASDGLRRHYQTLAEPPAAKLVTLHHGIELAAYPTLPARHRDTVRASFGIPAAAPLAISVAVLRPEKGLDLMLAAHQLLLQPWPQLHYLIVGDGEQRAELEAASVQLGLAERVRFAGWRTDVPRLLGCADLFVLPSREDALLPAVLAEAMAGGLPVVASAVGGVSEMIEDGGNGLLVPQGDVEALAIACDRLVASKRLRRAMGARGRQLVAERFAIDVQVERLAGLYDQLIAARRR
jgi:glycosyltransferase involved in cell wall biosynthesis